MFEPHESLPFPRDRRVQLWRYMDFTKYVAMLESQSLYFCRADHLGDPYESSMPEGMVKKYERQIKENKELGTDESIKRADILENNFKMFCGMSRIASISMYINCWHMNKHESDAMWKVYLNGGEGVAIRSSPSQFVRSIEHNNEMISLGKVVYADYKKLDLHGKDGGFNLLNFISRKRISFRHESEVRAVIWKRQEDENGIIVLPPSLQVPTDLHQLVNAVYVSPASPNWFLRLVESINDRYGLKAPVRASRMAQTPPQFPNSDGVIIDTKQVVMYKPIRYGELPNEANTMDKEPPDGIDIM